MILLRTMTHKLQQTTLLLFILIITPVICLGQFTIAKKPVNPACLNMINGSLSDMPFIYELNMDSCQSSNAAFAGANGTTSFTKGKDPKTQCTYSYKVIGKTTNGVYVISTKSHCADGSGIFTDLILTRLVKKQRYVYDSKAKRFHKKTYTALVFVANLGGGDRAVGSYNDLKVVGNKLLGKRYSRHGGPVPMPSKPSKNIIIDLSNIDGSS